jgi:hypothetical protein
MGFGRGPFILGVRFLTGASLRDGYAPRAGSGIEPVVFPDPPDWSPGASPQRQGFFLCRLPPQRVKRPQILLEPAAGLVRFHSKRLEMADPPLPSDLGDDAP